MSDAKARTGSDGYVVASTPAKEFPDTTRLQLQTPGTDTRRGFLFFKNPAPKGATVLSATLHLFGYGAAGTAATVTVRRVASKWAASDLNYNNQPDVTGATATLAGTQDADGKEWAFDVSTHIQELCDGAANYGFRLTTSSTTMHRFYSLDAPDFKPYLEVEWSDAPDAPTELSPAGGSAVSIAAPIVSFNFHDVAGSTQMASCQVQINSTNSFTSPAFDSGEVSTSDPELDLSTTAYAGLALGGTAWWRVRVKDAAGVWSDWSDAVSFTRVAKGTLTINSPTGGVVNDATQDVLWTLTGADQTSWRVTVWDDADASIVLYDSGRRSGTTSSFTLPKSVVTSESITYRLRVRVWDVLNRAHRPGDPAHTEVVTTFVFAEDGTAVPITGLTAIAQPNGLPHAQLDWSVATAPDSFAIVRDGVFVDTDLDPADLLVSGTSYRYIDKSVRPNQSHTYKVRPKRSGKLGGGSTASCAVSVSDVWLVDPDHAGTRLVPIKVNLDDCTFNMPEVSSPYQPVDAGADPVQLVQGQKGLAGTIVGRIYALASLSAEASTTDMLWFKEHPEQTVRMTIGNQNLRVNIRNVTLSPLAVRDSDARAVQFDFSALGGPST